MISAKTYIICVDDDRTVLNAIERDLRQKYGRDYRILKSSSGAAALDFAQQLLQRGDTVALLVVDQRMPEMTGVEFLEKAAQLFPEARKVLLTAYADTEAAIGAINRVGLDYYLMKPWDPPEEHFYPVLDGLLEEWQNNAHLPNDGIRVIGTLWSSGCHDLKDFLSRSSVPYRFLDLERDEEAARLLKTAEFDAKSYRYCSSQMGLCWYRPTFKRWLRRLDCISTQKNRFMMSLSLVEVQQGYPQRFMPALMD